MTEPKNTGIRKHLDVPSLFVILLTLVLFAAALVVKGFGHDLLLEGGVFLVSVKLIMMAFKGSVANERMMEELATVRSAVARLERSIAAGQHPVRRSDERTGGDEVGRGAADERAHTR